MNGNPKTSIPQSSISQHFNRHSQVQTQHITFQWCYEHPKNLFQKRTTIALLSQQIEQATEKIQRASKNPLTGLYCEPRLEQINNYLAIKGNQSESFLGLQVALGLEVEENEKTGK